jgi:hypothetical protein
MVTILPYRLYSFETMLNKEAGKVIINQRSGSKVNELCQLRSCCPLPLNMSDCLDQHYLGRIGDRDDLEIWAFIQC